MKNDNQSGGSTRRSFMKKSVVAAVAASNLTIFSGLVNAADPENDPERNGVKCKMVKVAGARGVCKPRMQSEGYPNTIDDTPITDREIFGCYVKCSPDNDNPGGYGAGEFLVWCTPDGVPANNGWYRGSNGCEGPEDHTQPSTDQ